MQCSRVVMVVSAVPVLGSPVPRTASNGYENEEEEEEKQEEKEEEQEKGEEKER